MYYEEQWIDGKLCWRTSPDGQWTAYTANELAHRYQSEQQRVAALTKERDAAMEALDCVLTEKPLPSGEYVHRVCCNGDRRKPPGTVGVTCSCHPGKAALDAEREKVRGLDAEVFQLKAEAVAGKMRHEAEVESKLKCADRVADLSKQLAQERTRREELESRINPDGQIDVMAWIGDLKAQLAAAQEHLAFLGATVLPDGYIELNMKKYHAAHRCEQHSEQPWQGIDAEIDCFVCLKTELSTLRGLVRALPKLYGKISNAPLEADSHGRVSLHISKQAAEAFFALSRYRQTLDAAPGVGE